jgi:ABC-2 type transport system ATP-binding protein
MAALLRDLVDHGVAILLSTHDLEEAGALADRVVVLARGRAVAAGTVDELRALVGSKQISCVTALDAAAVAAWPEVDSATVDRGRLLVTTRAAEGVVRRLLATDPTLTELEVRRAGLADAFRSLTEGAAS